MPNPPRTLHFTLSGHANSIAPWSSAVPWGPIADGHWAATPLQVCTLKMAPGQDYGEGMHGLVVDFSAFELHVGQVTPVPIPLTQPKIHAETQDPWHSPAHLRDQVIRLIKSRGAVSGGRG